MVLYAVDDLRRMLQSHANGNALRLHVDTGTGKVSVNVSRAVPRGQDDRATKLKLLSRHQVDGLYANYPFIPGYRLVDNKAGHLCLEVNLSSTSYYL